MLIAFMTWEGYNYEDAVLLNERLVREGKIEPMTQDEIDEDYERQVEARERAEQERERQEAARDNERIAAGQAQNQARPAIGFPAP